MRTLIEITNEGLKRIKNILEKKENHVINMGDDSKRGGIDGYIARQIDGQEIDYRTDAEVELQRLKQDIMKIAKRNNNEGLFEALTLISDFGDEYLPEEDE